MKLHYYKPEQVNYAAEYLWKAKAFPDKAAAYAHMLRAIKKLVKEELRFLSVHQYTIVRTTIDRVDVYVNPNLNTNQVVEVERDFIRKIEDTA